MLYFVKRKNQQQNKKKPIKSNETKIENQKTFETYKVKRKKKLVATVAALKNSITNQINTFEVNRMKSEFPNASRFVDIYLILYVLHSNAHLFACNVSLKRIISSLIFFIIIFSVEIEILRLWFAPCLFFFLLSLFFSHLQTH